MNQEGACKQSHWLGHRVKRGDTRNPSKCQDIANNSLCVKRSAFQLCYSLILLSNDVGEALNCEVLLKNCLPVHLLHHLDLNLTTMAEFQLLLVQKPQFVSPLLQLLLVELLHGSVVCAWWALNCFRKCVI